MSKRYDDANDDWRRKINQMCSSVVLSIAIAKQQRSMQIVFEHNWMALSSTLVSFWQMCTLYTVHGRNGENANINIRSFLRNCHLQLTDVSISLCVCQTEVSKNKKQSTNCDADDKVDGKVRIVLNFQSNVLNCDSTPLTIWLQWIMSFISLWSACKRCSFFGFWSYVIKFYSRWKINFSNHSIKKKTGKTNLNLSTKQRAKTPIYSDTHIHLPGVRAQFVYSKIHLCTQM